ncbi:hydrogenase formation protein HypD [Fervidicella metallireducens AeB]|uniref:Hydrogenase formation protein HypD n=1 Tax=Fervidicella metallireducens AeB TaxID=1403537 RepID=A0A017RUL4_9CLOT|nr:hydrogenase formation protein HypD [Fervidicella metallireducens]EYE88382.1 hydrogenase formation protein HypD [Fervidicella metallireducens AeB]
MLWNQFKNPQDIQRIVKAINEMDIPPIKIMEICGTHTMAIAKSGIRSLLPQNVKLISGPGCPVCVTPIERIDSIIELAKNRDVVIATYGDMLKVPGSKYGESLERLKAIGANVEMVYSAIDAVELAKHNKDKKVVFLGIGFETTTPGTSLAIQAAKKAGIKNFFVFSMHKLVEPILRGLIEMPDFDINGFICPGHVSVILGERGLEFLVKEYKIPSVICGFEAGDILTSIYKIMLQIKEGNAKLENEYMRAVSYEGNRKAFQSIFEYFEPCDDLWRGIGLVPMSGLKLKEEFSEYDAIEHFKIKLDNTDKETACKCGEVIKGKQQPTGCPLFGKTCTPENPVGPCMVSSEGACAAYYKYQVI